MLETWLLYQENETCPEMTLILMTLLNFQQPSSFFLVIETVQNSHILNGCGCITARVLTPQRFKGSKVHYNYNDPQQHNNY